MSHVRYRMLSALPEVLDPTINDLFETEIPELELITDLIFDTRRLMLLPEATEDWITRWEKALQVKPKTTDLEERRRYLITLISSKIKINSVSLQKITKSFTNVNNLVTVKDSAVHIRFLGELPTGYLNRFLKYVRELIPAHLGIQFSVEAPMINKIYISGHTLLDVRTVRFK